MLRLVQRRPANELHLIRKKKKKFKFRFFLMTEMEELQVSHQLTHNNIISHLIGV